MSLRSALEGLIDAHRERTAALNGVPYIKVALSADKAAEALNGHIYKNDPTWPTMDELLDKFKVYSVTHPREWTIGLLLRFAIDVPPSQMVEKVQSMWIGQWKNFVEYMRCSDQFGLDPAYPWTVGQDGEPVSRMFEAGVATDSPDEMRTRWLMWHPESVCLWVIDNYEEMLGVLATGEPLDVTGLPEWEERFELQECPAADGDIANLEDDDV